MKSIRAKKLTLSRETVTLLNTADLTQIAGGFVDFPPYSYQQTCPTDSFSIYWC